MADQVNWPDDMAGPVAPVPPGKVDAARARPAFTPRVNPWLAAAAGALLPGAGHALLGYPRKAAIFCGLLLFMMIVGLAFGGRLFPFELTEPLVFLAAVSEWAVFVPRVIAGVAGAGQGDVVRATFDYGNTFLIAGGLLNILVLLDAFDRARGMRSA